MADIDHMNVVKGIQRLVWITASPNVKLPFWEREEEGIPYRPDLQPCPPPHLRVGGYINGVPRAHCLQQDLISY